jgi:hypothetical protein
VRRPSFEIAAIITCEMRELRALLADKDDVIADLPQQRDQERVAALLTDLRPGRTGRGGRGDGREHKGDDPEG